MRPCEAVDLLMIGHFARDRLVVDGRSESASGGGVYYGSIALRRLGVSVAVVTRLRADDFHFLEELRQEGVQVFAAVSSETSGIENTYDSTDMERRVCKPLGFAGAFGLEEIPDLRAEIYVASGIIAGEIGLALLENLAQRGPVALDIQGFVRVRDGCDLVFRPWPDLKRGLSLVTYLKADRAEAELLTSQTDLRTAARELAGFGPREVLITQSSGVLVLADGVFHQAPFDSRSLRGRTGRGDTCFATYLGTRLSATPREATRVAAAVTTLKQEQPGPWRGSLEDVRAMLADGPDSSAGP